MRSSVALEERSSEAGMTQPPRWEEHLCDGGGYNREFKWNFKIKRISKKRMCYLIEGQTNTEQTAAYTQQDIAAHHNTYQHNTLRTPYYLLHILPVYTCNPILY